MVSEAVRLGSILFAIPTVKPNCPTQDTQDNYGDYFSVPIFIVSCREEMKWQSNTKACF